MRPAKQNPLLRRRIDCSLVFFSELVNVFGKIPSLASGTSLLSCSPLWRSVSQISQRRDFADEEFGLVFHQMTDLRCSPRESYSSNWFSTLNRFGFMELTFGRMPLTKRFGANTFQEVFTRPSIELLRLDSASRISVSRRTSPRVLEDCGSESGAAFGVSFARSLLSCRKLHLSPFEHCLFSFHW